MNREILFKGKRLDNGEWVEGDLLKDYHGNTRILKQIPNEHNDDLITINNEVDKKTVSQYCGLNQNGDRIFENDIIKYSIFDYNDNDTQFKGIVKYNGSRFIITQIPDSLCNGDYGVDLDWMIDQDCEAEVIGNIHNKEIK